MDKTKYNSNWADTVRPAILKRDNYKCTKCKVRHRSRGYWNYKGEFTECDNFMIEWALKKSIKIVTVILQVHHKDDNKKNDDPGNLITLCQRCHLEAERDLNVLKKKVKGIIYKK